MNKNSVIIVFSILAVGTVLFWVRLSSTEAQMGPSQHNPAAMTVKGAAQQNPAQMAAILNALSKNMAPWLQINDQERILAVAAVMEMFKTQSNTIIKNPAPYYVQRINQTLGQNAATREMPLDRLLMIMAVMEFDFDNGQDKEQLAKEVLGEKMFMEIMKAREQAKLAG